MEILLGAFFGAFFSWCFFEYERKKTFKHNTQGVSLILHKQHERCLELYRFLKEFNPDTMEFREILNPPNIWLLQKNEIMSLNNKHGNREVVLLIWDIIRVTDQFNALIFYINEYNACIRECRQNENNEMRSNHMKFNMMRNDILNTIKERMKTICFQRAITSLSDYLMKYYPEIYKDTPNALSQQKE